MYNVVADLLLRAAFSFMLPVGADCIFILFSVDWAFMSIAGIDPVFGI